jgi:hypothetical protein
MSNTSGEGQGKELPHGWREGERKLRKVQDKIAKKKKSPDNQEGTSSSVPINPKGDINQRIRSELLDVNPSVGEILLPGENPVNLGPVENLGNQRAEEDNTSLLSNSDPQNLAHTFALNNIEHISNKNFSINQLETMKRKLVSNHASNSFRNGLFIDQARNMLQALLGRYWVNRDLIDHEEFFELLKNKVRSRMEEEPLILSMN